MSHVVEKIELGELLDESTEKSHDLVAREMDMIAHVQVELVAEVGYATINLNRLFALKAGEVVALVQSVDDPVLLRLNGKPVARGELVAVNDNFGVKITEIL